MDLHARVSATILVVDDNADNRALARATLEDEEYTVIIASGGQEALDLMAASLPDCVLLDVRMPGMDGFAVCDRIRSLPGGKDIPIVFVTALRDLETFDRASRAGGDDFLTKPFRPPELLVRVETALKLRRMSAELREHYDLVRRQRDDLMRLQLQKERLSMFVVHDLKNPVSSMDLHAQLLLRNRELPQSARESVGRIRDEARALLRLLLNLLDISKSEEGQLVAQLAEIDPVPFVREMLDALEIKASTGSVKLEHVVALESQLRADVDLLRRVIENLLENAVRHAPEHSTVCIDISEDAAAVLIRVSDEGPGVPQELREKIFERFVQLDHGARVIQRSGRGLGLTFCKLAIEAHGGSIWIEDKQPGAAFCVRLPK